MSNKECLETPTSQIKLRDDGILETRFKDGVEETLETAKLFFDAHLEILGSRGPLPLLIITGQRTKATAEVRKYIGESESWARISTRVAIMTSSMVSKVLVNFIIKFKKVPIPVQLFTNEVEALAWLKEGGK